MNVSEIVPRVGADRGPHLAGGAARVAAASLAPASVAAEKDSPAEARAPTDLQLFLVLGLPNLPARGAVEAIDRQLHPRVLVMNKEFGWSRTIDAADWTEAELTPVELASAAARTVVEGRPAVQVGVIPAAFGGKSLDDWIPGTALYRGAVERTRIAQKDGKLVGIFWYQGPTGEDPAQAASYAKRFAAMIAQLRLDLGVKFVPVIVGEVKLGATSVALATPLSEVPQQVIPCFFVSSEGLRGAEGTSRFDSKALWEYNERFIRAWMDLAQP